MFVVKNISVVIVLENVDTSNVLHLPLVQNVCLCWNKRGTTILVLESWKTTRFFEKGYFFFFEVNFVEHVNSFILKREDKKNSVNEISLRTKWN